MQIPEIGPEAVLGIELNAYAAELARVTVWIGEIQWMIRHGLGWRRNPILRTLDHIENRDALLDLADPAKPREAEWPAAEFIVGNPPFLGGKLLRRGLGNRYVEAMFEVFDGRVPREADLSAYFHEKVRSNVAAGLTSRGGLLATQGIRGGANRRVLEHIKRTGDIFFARSDDPWILSGANVHISFVAQDDGSEAERELDGRRVESINANLTSGIDLSQARRLRENLGVSFMGDTKGGPFDIDAPTARQLLAQPNPDGRSNSDVVRPWVNGLDITRRPRGMWIIDFGVDMPQHEAALYEAPFEYVRRTVRPERLNNARGAYADRWWLHVEPRQGMRAGLLGLTRFIGTPRLAKHRLFVWLDERTLPDSQIIVVARDDDYTLGVLQSRVHELWALAMGTQLETRPRYTPTTTFETFPFPDPTPDQRARVGEAATRLDDFRNGWLSPPGLDPAELEKRTLTNLYNQRPTWLANAHADLGAAVLAAYGWPVDLRDDAILARLLALNLARLGKTG
jgi:type II restriction/modification system DNA methylase subunit YeeA